MTPSDIAGLSERLRDALVDDPNYGLCLRMSLSHEDVAAAATSLDSLTARVKELEANGRKLAETIRDMHEAGLALRQQRDEAYERAAKICDAEFDRIISKQTPTDDPLSMADTVNTNIRMMACILPEVAAAIRRLASGPEGGEKHQESKP